MQLETNNAFAQLSSAVLAAGPRGRRVAVAGALKVIVVAAVLFTLLGMEITLRIAPQSGIIGTVAIVWIV